MPQSSAVANPGRGSAAAAAAPSPLASDGSPDNPGAAAALGGDDDKNDENDGADVPLYEESYHPPFLAALALFPPALPLFWRYRVRVTLDELEFGYSFSATSVALPRSRIASAEAVPRIRGLWDWGGWGIRLNRQWEWGYISKDGPGIRITVMAAPPQPGGEGPPSSSDGKEATAEGPSATTSSSGSGSTAGTASARLTAYTFLCDDAERVAKMLAPP